MKAFSRLGVLTLVLVVVFGASCVPLDQPLTDATNSVPDLSLVGHWLCTNNDDTSKSWYVGRKAGADNVLEMVTAYVDDQQHVTIEHYDLFTTAVGDLKLGTMSQLDGGKFIALMLYEMPDSNTVHVYQAAAEPWKKAVQDGTLKGKLQDGNLQVITDTPANVRAFLKEHGKGAFNLKENYLSFRRVPK